MEGNDIEVSYCLYEIKELLSQGHELDEVLYSLGLESLEEEIQEELQYIEED